MSNFRITTFGKFQITRTKFVGFNEDPAKDLKIAENQALRINRFTGLTTRVYKDEQLVLMLEGK